MSRFQKSLTPLLEKIKMVHQMSFAQSVLEPLELIVQRKIGLLHQMKNILDNPEHPLHNSYSTIESFQSGASSNPLQHRPLQEILPADIYNHLQWLFQETLIMTATPTIIFPSGNKHYWIELKWIENLNFLKYGITRSDIKQFKKLNSSFALMFTSILIILT